MLTAAGIDTLSGQQLRGEPNNAPASISVSPPANGSIVVAYQPSIRRCPVSASIDHHRSIIELIDLAARLCVSMKNTVTTGQGERP